MRKSNRPYIVWRKSGGSKRAFFRSTWTEDGKQRSREFAFKSAPDTPEFDREYWAFRSGMAPAMQPPPPKTSWAALAREYRSSPRYLRLKPSTRRAYDRIIEAILASNGLKDVSDLTRAEVRAIHQKHAELPRKADWYVQIISMLLNFAANTLDWKVKNVAEGIELYGKQREFEPWPDWMVTALDGAPERVRTAAELILGTGQRPNAAITMRRADFSGDRMSVLDEKGGERFEVFCPAELRDYVASLPQRGDYLLAKNLTQPLGYDSIEKSFRAWRETLGDRAKPYSLHGLRKLAIMRLAEAGWTDAQIQAATNQSAEMVAYYRKRADRIKLTRAPRTDREQKVNL